MSRARYLMALCLALVAGCSQTNRPQDEPDGDADADADVGPTGECDGVSECVLACRGDCCACPEVVTAALLESDPGLLPLSGEACESACEMACDPCPPRPEPACIGGYCMPREGCVTSRDCTLVTDCQCRCFIPATWAEALTNSCYVPQRDPSTGCEDCLYDPSDCQPCPPEPERAFCAAGHCFPEYGAEADLGPCGGLGPDCPAGYECVPGDRDCGFGTTGICLPAPEPRCGGGSGTPCRETGHVCLPASGCEGCPGICVTPSESRRVCSVAPDCFECD